LFLRLNKKRNRTKEKKKERYGTSGFHPETLDLFDEQTHQTKVFSREFTRAVPRKEKSVFSFLVTFFSFLR